MRKSHKVILIAVVALVTLGLVGNYSNFFGTGTSRQQRRQKPTTTEKQRQPEVADLKVERAADNKTISYVGFESKTALELLRLVGHVETKNFGELGDMVTAIDGIAADDKHFWGFYVNGKLSDVGAANYQTKQSDKVEWKYEEIQ